MSSSGRSFALRYADELQTYLHGPTEAGLARAEGLGRQALSEGVGLMEIIEAHFSVDERSARPVGARRDREPPAGLVFLLQTVAAFEIVHTGFAEAQGRVAVERLHVQRLQNLARATT
ncbi:MAG: hypothetical protein J2P57_02585, partial [Acidimicrobiaceae bacterium]|nr:hypothetical protein [Acidimicrobiaceae bacterium]